MKLLALLLLSASCWALCGCGGTVRIERVSQHELAQCRAAHADFINHTRLTEAQILKQWTAAQEDIAEGVYLDIFSQPPRQLILDARAKSIAPDCVQIESQPDVQPGIILLNGNRVHSWVSFDGDTEVVVGADSLLEVALEYEFQNILLHRLGYSTERR